MLERVWSKGNPPTLLVGILIHTATMEDHGKFCKRLKTELLYDPAVPLLSIYLEKTLIWKDTYTSKFTAALFTIVKTWEQPKCPLTGEKIKMCYIDILKYYSTMEKNEMMPFAATWMDLQIIIVRKARQIMYDISLCNF